MDNADWTLVRSFLAVAESGSLSAAARLLALSQPTLGRHIADLEQQLEVALFSRQPRGLLPTEAATALLPHARAMRESAARFNLTAVGRGEGIAGTVRITASRIVAHHILPSMLAQLRLAEPGIQFEIVPSDTSENLLFREADIAVRMYRPTQLDVITRHVCDLPLALYATPSYTARMGVPQSQQDLLTHDFVGFDQSDQLIKIMRSFGMIRRREDFALRCDDQIVYWNLVRAGCGIGGMQTLIGDADPTVLRIAPFIALPALPVWLTAATALHQSPRIRRVFDYLSASFRALPLDP